MTEFPNLRRATTLIALDIGGINRTCSENEVLDRLTAFLADMDPEPIGKIDQWLGTLSEADFETITIGEHSEMVAVSARGPQGVDALLDLIAEEVA